MADSNTNDPLEIIISDSEREDEISDNQFKSNNHECFLFKYQLLFLTRF